MLIGSQSLAVLLPDRFQPGVPSEMEENDGMDMDEEEDEEEDEQGSRPEQLMKINDLVPSEVYSTCLAGEASYQAMKQIVTMLVTHVGFDGKPNLIRLAHPLTPTHIYT